MSLPHRIAGRLARLYWRVRRPRTLGVRAILTDPDGRIALVRHTYITGWYLPGGGVKKGESSATAILRELAEEVGIAHAAITHIQGAHHSRREGKDDHIILFAITVDADQAAKLRATDVREIEAAQWFAPAALPPGLSPATARRIAEYRAGATGTGDW